ncbi:MAG: DinB family protein [Cyclobacteriaceae bacterium]
MGAPGIRGVVMDKWPTFQEIEQEFKSPATRKELLELWDKATVDINLLWPQIPPQRFQKVVRFFSQYEGPVYWSILYLIDNEIHHRAQGYVYLRSLGIRPPFFWDRG